MAEPTQQHSRNIEPSSQKYVLVGTNFHNAEERQATSRYTRSKNNKDFPENVTLGFRSNFWRVFSSLTEYDNEDFEFKWLNRRWTFVSLWVVESNGVDFSAYLDEKHNVIVIFVLKLLDDEDPRLLRQWHFQLRMSEQDALQELFQCFRERSFFGFLSTFRHKLNLNALFTWSTPDQMPIGTPLSNVIALFAFYSFAMLVIWNIARELTYINISKDQRYFRQTLDDVLDIRGRIINLDRYFLTKNISNDCEVSKVARDMKGRFELTAKQSNFMPLIEAMERHIVTASQIRADINSRRLNTIVLIVAVVGLPLSLMSMLLAFNPDAVPILKDGMVTISKRSAAIFFGVASAVSLAVIALAYLFIELISSEKGRNSGRQK